MLIAVVGLMTQSIIEPGRAYLAMDLATNSSPSVVKDSDMHKPTDQESAMISPNEMPTPSSTTVLGTVLFDYADEDSAWYTVNDEVMGGVSNSSVSTDVETQRLTFSGTLSLENNGGFASIRSPWASYDLTGYDGIVLRVLGDGRIYQFRIRTAETGSEVAYAALFETEAGVWKDVYIAFEDMIPVYRGIRVSQAPDLDPAGIRSFGFLLANKQQGEFMLEVETISAVVAGNLQV
jgi:monofunctional biosynthetic peptidoglycan transglycosylase